MIVALSEVLGALSYALDITEGEPPGHAVRTTAIGMRLAEEIARIVRGRLTNPRWIAGMLAHGHRGVAEIAQGVDALYAFAATTRVVPDHLFDATHAALIADEAVRTEMTEKNPAAAAAIAVATLEANAAESPIALVLRCHEELKGTRGAVMTLAFVHRRDHTLTWLGVGNVEAALCHAGSGAAPPDHALLRSGVIGYRLPPVRAELLPLKPLDTLIIVTDGIFAVLTNALGI